jgi:ankyrin repeat protein
MKTYKVFFTFLFLLTLHISSCFSMEQYVRQEVLETKTTSDSSLMPIELSPEQIIQSEIFVEAAVAGDTKKMKKAHESGAYVNYKDRSGKNALHFAAEYLHLDVVKYILSIKGVDVNGESPSGWTALDYVISNQKRKTTKAGKVIYTLLLTAKAHQGSKQKSEFAV